MLVEFYPWDLGLAAKGGSCMHSGRRAGFGIEQIRHIPLFIPINVLRWTDESVSNSIGASFTGWKPFATKRSYFVRRPMPAVVGSVNSRSLRHLPRFKRRNFDFFLRVARHNCLLLSFVGSLLDILTL